MWWRQHLQFGGRSFRQRRFGSEKRSSHHNSKIFTNNARIKESPNIFTNNARIKANIITINPRIRLASKYRATQATTETVRTIITGPECYIHLWAVACSGLWILGANSYESLSLDALTIPPSLSFINFLGIYVVPHRHDFKPRPPHPLPLFFPSSSRFSLAYGISWKMRNLPGSLPSDWNEASAASEGMYRFITCMSSHIIRNITAYY